MRMLKKPPAPSATVRYPKGWSRGIRRRWLDSGIITLAQATRQSLEEYGDGKTTPGKVAQPHRAHTGDAADENGGAQK